MSWHNEKCQTMKHNLVHLASAGTLSTYEAQAHRADELVFDLKTYGARYVRRDARNVGAYDYYVHFCFAPPIVVSVHLELMEHQTESDVVITNVSLIPLEERGKRRGTLVIHLIQQWAREYGFNEIRATQIATNNARFWMRNDFVPDPDHARTSDYIFRIAQ
jgi:hypothetical protein